MKDKRQKQEDKSITRRRFLKASVTIATAAGGAAAGCGAAMTAETKPKQPDAEKTTATAASQGNRPEENEPVIKKTRILGRTGFEVSDISMGCGWISESNVVRYAYDNGVNLFDVAESYGEGDSEIKIGQAMPNLDRKKIFIVTKLSVKDEDDEQSLVDRFGKCLERMNTNYADALYMHAVKKTADVKNTAFHSAVARLKADGRLKHAGISSHGPRDVGQNTMDEVLLAAVEDGRFDLMLLVYNFMKTEEGERVLKACKEKNIGTTGMKTYAGVLDIGPFDPDNPSEEHARILNIHMKRGRTRDEAVSKMLEQQKSREQKIEEQKPFVQNFVSEHGIKTQSELDKASIRWVLDNPDMHTVCVSMGQFDRVDEIMPLSGTRLTASNRRLLRDFKAAFSGKYCRHGCTDCLDLCPYGVPASTIMRYTYYFKRQGREKYAMQKYAELNGSNGLSCLDCDAPCMKGCPYDVDVRSSLIKAHGMLTFA